MKWLWRNTSTGLLLVPVFIAGGVIIGKAVQRGDSVVFGWAAVCVGFAYAAFLKELYRRRDNR